MVEFAIVFPVAMLFVMALLQTGFAYMAKLHLNHITFLAARTGAVHNADSSAIRTALLRGLSPFYQNSFETNDNARLAAAWAKAKLADIDPTRMDVTMLNPSAESFKDFGVKDPKTGRTYIPNDNLEWRTNAVGASSRQNLRDANLLKLRVVYGYELKVPLMAGVLRRVMCGGSTGVEAWGDVSLFSAVYSPASAPCLKYYLLGRIPIESTAIVEMQSRAEKP